MKISSYPTEAGVMLDIGGLHIHFSTEEGLVQLQNAATWALDKFRERERLIKERNKNAASNENR